jgi:hypothetical protein
MIIVNDRPCNGVDVSHWIPDPLDLMGQDWIEFFGHKATHIGGSGMVNGVDPKLAARRRVAARLDIRWRAFFTWIVPFTTARPAVQVELLARTMGDLVPGESVYLDWEDKLVTLAMMDELSFYMDLEFGDRWFTYVNDSTQDMINWLNNNKVNRRPVMHPNWNLDIGLSEARKWDAMIWQTAGEAPAPGFPKPVSIDFVLKPSLLDRVCGR